jgi:HEAT repeat protein|tara:strand:- start:384 stop:1127 length:744 start_codon:yes stop_codon:yes gene_type:complete
MNAAEGSVQHAIVADVTSLLAHPHESVRRTAAEALLRIPANEWQTAELTALLVGQAQQVFDPGLALTAIEALAQLPPTRLKAHATAIVSLLGRDDSTLRRAAVAPLGVLAPSALANVAPALLEAIVKLGASEDDLELETACSLPRLLRRLPTAALLPRLATVVELLRHPFSEVRLTAVALVGSLAGEFDPALVARLAELLDHAGELHSEQVRCAALEALGEVGAVAPAALATVAGAVLYRLASTSVS